MRNYCNENTNYRFWKAALFLLVIVLGCESKCNKGVDILEEVFSWKRFTFKNQGLAGQNGSFFEIPMGIEISRDKLFLSFVRRRSNSPLGLGYIDLTTAKTKSPDVIPYPSAEFNNLTIPNSGKIITTYRTTLDSCNRLWFVDTGILYSNGKTFVLQQPSLIIIDLETDTVLRNYTLLNGRDILYSNPAGLVSLTIDVVDGDCEQTFAYIPDMFHIGVIVYSFFQNTSWRVKHNFFGFDPDEGDFNVNGLKFQFNDGIFSIALGPTIGETNYRVAYFHGFSSYKERVVSTEVFRNRTLATRTYHDKDFRVVGYKGKNSNSNIHALDLSAGVIFWSLPAQNGISCWNIRNTPLRSSKISLIVSDDQLFTYPSDLKIDRDGYLWMYTNKYTFYLFSKINPNETNFRIYRIPVKDAIEGTKCQMNY